MPVPTLDQIRAVRLGLERATAQGQFAGYSPLVRALPPTRIAWDSPWLPENAQACMRIHDDGTVTLSFRSTASPRSLVVSALHEVVHAADVPAIVTGMPRAYTEWQAQRAEAYARDVYEVNRWLSEPHAWRHRDAG
jgi:hypothetical protein